jgi:hypothetical protein
MRSRSNHQDMVLRVYHFNYTCMTSPNSSFKVWLRENQLNFILLLPIVDAMNELVLPCSNQSAHAYHIAKILQRLGRCGAGAPNPL